MAGICNLAYIGESKKLCYSFGKEVDVLLAVCMLVQEVQDMLFHTDIPRLIKHHGEYYEQCNLFLFSSGSLDFIQLFYRLKSSNFEIDLEY